MDNLIQVDNLKKYFSMEQGFASMIFGRKDVVHAVDDVSFHIRQGETLGLVGESGCGKSTIGKTILRLMEPTQGKISFKGEDVSKASHSKLRKLRKEMQMIFQDPLSSLNPRKTIGEIVGQGIDNFHLDKGSDRRSKIEEALNAVNMSPQYMDRYPHEFSGGQRQRIGIARALAVEPSFIVCDEPVSALDVSIRAQILNLLRHLQKEYNLTYLFIGHDLSVVKHVSDTISVMYLGRIVETAECEELFKNPRHPYTIALLSAIPIPDPDIKRDRIILKGSIPSPVHLPSGCRFRTRCPFAVESCSINDPVLEEVSDNHFVACPYEIPVEDWLDLT